MISTLFEPVCYGPKRMPLKCTCNPIQDTLHATYEVDHCVCQHSMLKGFCFLFLCFKKFFLPGFFSENSVLQLHSPTCVQTHIHTKHKYFLFLVSGFLAYYCKQNSSGIESEMYIFKKNNFNSILKNGWVLCANLLAVTRKEVTLQLQELTLYSQLSLSKFAGRPHRQDSIQKKIRRSQWVSMQWKYNEESDLLP